MAYRRPKSLRDLLVHAKLKADPKDNEPLGESKPCGRARCQTCKMILGTQTVKSSSGAVVKLKCDKNCKTANVVCCLSHFLLQMSKPVCRRDKRSVEPQDEWSSR